MKNFINQKLTMSLLATFCATCLIAFAGCNEGPTETTVNKEKAETIQIDEEKPMQTKSL